MTTIGGLGEAELLRQILPYLATSGYEVVAGADDAAVWRSIDEESPVDYVVASCDTAVEGVHFDFEFYPRFIVQTVIDGAPIHDLAHQDSRGENASQSTRHHSLSSFENAAAGQRDHVH